MDGAGIWVEDGLNAHTFGVRCRPDGVERGLDDMRQLHRRNFEAHLARGDPTEVEDVFNQRGLRPRVSIDGLERPIALFLGERSAPQHSGPSDDRVERGAELVAQAAEEEVLRSVRLFCARAFSANGLEQAGVVDRDGGLGGDGHENPLVAFLENADVGVAEKQPAVNRAGTGHDRHGQVAPHRKVAGRHPVVGRVAAVARVFRDVVGTHDALAPEGGGEHVGVPRHREAGELLPRHTGERVKHVAALVGASRRCRRRRRTAPGTPWWLRR